MPISLTPEQVLALAPDAAAAAAGRKLGAPRGWQNLGSSERVIWGECQGSALYRTQVALADFAAKCSCPSRKFPCKHGLGLLLLAAQTPGALPAADEPSWVGEWLAKRATAQEKKEARQAGPAKVADIAQQAKRAAQRHDRVLKGLDQLDVWLEDLVRRGIGQVESEPPSFWEQQAKRLIDAQAPGLAGRVRRLAEVPRSSPDWTGELLDRLGQLMLASHAFRRLDRLDPLLRQDLLQVVGFTVDQDVVRAEGPRLSDVWSVVAQSTDVDDRVRVQRSWLRGEASGRSALILQFAVGPTSFPEVIATGTAFKAELAFWPSAQPLRALVLKRDGAATAAGSVAGAPDLEAFLADAAALFARLPWLDAAPALLKDVTPVIDESGRVLVRDLQGRTLPLTGEEHLRLLAISGGRAVDLAGEWDGYRLRPLTAWAEGRCILLGGAARA